MESVPLKAYRPSLSSYGPGALVGALGRHYLPLLKPGLTAAIVLSAVAAAFATARGDLTPTTLWALTAVVFLASSGSCVLNHFLDRDIDGVMDRTKARPIPSGRIVKPERLFWLGLALIGASLVLSQLFLNWVATVHLFMGAFVYVVVYTVWLKRRHALNIVIGGLAGSFAVLAGGASVRPELCLTPLLVALIVFLWTPSHFWSLAVAKRSDYLKAKVPMLPVLIGDRRTALAILASTALLVLSSLLPYLLGVFGELYLASVVLVGIFFVLRNGQLVLRPTVSLAEKNFKASMVYLLILLFAVIADTAVSSFL